MPKVRSYVLNFPIAIIRFIITKFNLIKIFWDIFLSSVYRIYKNCRKCSLNQATTGKSFPLRENIEASQEPSDFYQMCYSTLAVTAHSRATTMALLENWFSSQAGPKNNSLFSMFQTGGKRQLLGDTFHPTAKFAMVITRPAMKVFPAFDKFSPYSFD